MVAPSYKLRTAKMTIRTCAHTLTSQIALEAGQCPLWRQPPTVSPLNSIGSWCAQNPLLHARPLQMPSGLKLLMVKPSSAGSAVMPDCYRRVAPAATLSGCCAPLLHLCPRCDHRLTCRCRLVPLPPHKPALSRLKTAMMSGAPGCASMSHRPCCRGATTCKPDTHTVSHSSCTSVSRRMHLCCGTSSPSLVLRHDPWTRHR